MADDSIEIIEPFDFHPCNSPRGMLYYDLNVLTDDQQIKLNDFKTNVVRENEKYLARHPEVRAVVALITRHVLQHRPRSDLHEFVGHFFARPRPDIEDEVDRYIEAREPHIYEGDSAVVIRDESSVLTPEQVSSITYEEEDLEEEEDLAAVPRQILDEILQQAYQRLGIDVDDMDGWKSAEPEETSESIVKSIIDETLKRVVKDDEDRFYSTSSFNFELDEHISYVTTETPTTNESQVDETSTETDLETKQDVVEVPLEAVETVGGEGAPEIPQQEQIAVTEGAPEIAQQEKTTVPEAVAETTQPEQTIVPEETKQEETAVVSEQHATEEKDVPVEQ